MKKKVLFLALLVIMAIFLGACSEEDEKPAIKAETLSKIWRFSFFIAADIEELLERFSPVFYCIPVAVFLAILALATLNYEKAARWLVVILAFIMVVLLTPLLTAIGVTIFPEDLTLLILGERLGWSNSTAWIVDAAESFSWILASIHSGWQGLLVIGYIVSLFATFPAQSTKPVTIALSACLGWLLFPAAIDWQTSELAKKAIDASMGTIYKTNLLYFLFSGLLLIACYGTIPFIAMLLAKFWPDFPEYSWGEGVRTGDLLKKISATELLAGLAAVSPATAEEEVVYVNPATEEDFVEGEYSEVPPNLLPGPDDEDEDDIDKGEFPPDANIPPDDGGDFSENELLARESGSEDDIEGELEEGVLTPDSEGTIEPDDFNGSPEPQIPQEEIKEEDLLQAADEPETPEPIVPEGLGAAADKVEDTLEAASLVNPELAAAKAVVDKSKAFLTREESKETDDQRSSKDKRPPTKKPRSPSFLARVRRTKDE